MADSYSIWVTERGVVVGGLFPLERMKWLGRLAKHHGFTWADQLIAGAIGATFVYVSRKSGAEWRARLGLPDASAKEVPDA